MILPIVLLTNGKTGGVNFGTNGTNEFGNMVPSLTDFGGALARDTFPGCSSAIPSTVMSAGGAFTTIGGGAFGCPCVLAVAGGSGEIYGTGCAAGGTDDGSCVICFDCAVFATLVTRGGGKFSGNTVGNSGDNVGNFGTVGRKCVRITGGAFAGGLGGTALAHVVDVPVFSQSKCTITFSTHILEPFGTLFFGRPHDTFSLTSMAQ